MTRFTRGERVGGRLTVSNALVLSSLLPPTYEGKPYLDT